MRLENMIPGEIKMGKHHAKCRALAKGFPNMEAKLKIAISFQLEMTKEVTKRS